MQRRIPYKYPLNKQPAKADTYVQKNLINTRIPVRERFKKTRDSGTQSVNLKDDQETEEEQTFMTSADSKFLLPSLSISRS